MTDRIHSITLVLGENIREDDIQPLITACAQLRHVIDVKTNVSDFDTATAESRARCLVVSELSKLSNRILNPRPRVNEIDR